MIVFPAVFVEIIVLRFHKDAILKVRLIQLAVVDGNFRCRVAIEGVEQGTVAFKHRLFVCLRGNLIVDVLKFVGPAVLVFPYPKQSVVINGADGNCVLHASWQLDVVFFSSFLYAHFFSPLLS